MEVVTPNILLVLFLVNWNSIRIAEGYPIKLLVKSVRRIVHLCCTENEKNLEFKSLSRLELQDLAKTSGVRANLKSSEIIEQLLERKRAHTTENKTIEFIPKFSLETVNDDHRKIAQGNDDVELNGDLKQLDSLGNPYIVELMKEQGIVMNDLLQLRDSILAKSNVVKVYKDKSRIRSRPHFTGKTDSSDPSDPSVNSFHQNEYISSPNAELQELHLSNNDLQRSTNIETKSATPAKKSEESSIEPNLQSKDAVHSPPPLIQTISASNKRAKSSLEGVSLKDMLEYLEKEIGFGGLYEQTNLRCFSSRPSINSSLKALRQTNMQWAREKIESLYRAYM